MKFLEVKWSLSKARDSEGYNVCTLWDAGTRYRAIGGGYDMRGTVFGQWLQTLFLDRIKEKLIPVNYDIPQAERKENSIATYGFFHHEKSYWLDGACGLDCMEHIAREIGLKVTRIVSGKKHILIGFSVEDTKK